MGEIWSKDVWDVLKPVPPDPTDLSDRWHQRDGDLNATGRALKNRVLAYLNGLTAGTKLSVIRDDIVSAFPDDYMDHDGQGKPTRRNINSSDIKMAVDWLVANNKVVIIKGKYA